MALGSPRLPLLTCLVHLFLQSPAQWPRLWGDCGSLFTGQAEIRFLTAPPSFLCQGKLALQNRSLTGKCVSLFISHSHWKKGGVGGGVTNDVILSTELLKGIVFRGDFQALLVFLCTVHTERNPPRAQVYLLLPSLCLGWGYAPWESCRQP